MGAYRSDEAALRERLSGIERELWEIDARQRAAAELEREKADLQHEREQVTRRLWELRGAPTLEGLRIASPCRASWESMPGDDRVRFCGACKKNVYNFSGMTRAEAVGLVSERTAEICVRMFQRADGTVLTADCPVGARKKTVRRLVVVSAAGLGLAAAGVGMYGATATMGAVGPERVGQVEAKPTESVVMGTPVAEPSAKVEAQEGVQVVRVPEKRR